MTLKYNDTGEEVVLLQRSLNFFMNKKMTTDGHFGKITEESMRAYQTRYRTPVTGIYSDAEKKTIEPYIVGKFLRYSEIDAFANKAKLPPSVIKAIRLVEAKGNGFLPDGRVIILFERHKFYKEISTKFGKARADQIAKLHPSICNPLRGGYKGNEAEYPRIELAMKFDRDCALLSASYGLFQIMGFNYKAAGFANVNAFYEAMNSSEKDQLVAVINFIKADRNLKQAVINKDFKTLARLYNGPAYAENNYDIKLRDAERKFA